MNSRDSILAAIRSNRPARAPLPKVAVPAAPNDLMETFVTNAKAAGAAVVGLSGAELENAIRNAYPDARVVASLVEGVPGGVDVEAVEDPHALEALDLFVCRGTFGVAENGAIWLSESNIGHRAAPFLAQHLAIVLGDAQIVATMHDAYARLHDGSQEGFGVFVAGPSKTADIEQSLVHGAHGPRSLTIVLAPARSDSAARTVLS